MNTNQVESKTPINDTVFLIFFIAAGVGLICVGLFLGYFLIYQTPDGAGFDDNVFFVAIPCLLITATIIRAALSWEQSDPDLLATTVWQKLGMTIMALGCVAGGYLAYTVCAHLGIGVTPALILSGFVVLIALYFAFK